MHQSVGDEVITAEVPVHLIGEAQEVERADGMVEQGWMTAAERQDAEVPGWNADGPDAQSFELGGGVVLAGAGDLVTLVVALETLTLPLYVLVGLRRSDTRGVR